MGRSIAEAKHAARCPLLESRGRRAPDQRAVVEEALAAHLLALPSIGRAGRVVA